jgi:molecular chaperone HtpG
MATGNINVTAENIFPIIKKFLYSDHEIFLRELISNATDATLKLKHLSSLGEIKFDIGEPMIEIKVDKEKKEIRIIDQGIGMTEEEVEKYINQVAFSGAEEFVNKYKDKVEDSGIIGHFGLGFYSSFMVAKKVEILTKSHQEGSTGVRWECDGSPKYTTETIERAERGTEIVLHIDDESTEFLEDQKITELLNKYNKFMPIPIKFGTNEETLPLPENAEKDAKPETKTVDNIINNPNPAWTKAPSELKDENYKNFYRELYPMQFEEPLFHIHLNVDYPFNLTGILYFPKLQKNLDPSKDRIQLYQNQVFVTDNVEGIVPDFLQMLRGVIDSPDIPLNVSRSYLQADGAVKKISNYITKKVADKLANLFKNDRKAFEEKWDDIKVIIEYGMLSEDKFFEKSDNFTLFPTTTGNYLTWQEVETQLKPNQTDKDDKFVILYTSDAKAQHSYIQAAKEKGYEVLLLDSPIVSHLLQKFESTKEKIQFTRVDSDHVDNLIKKDENTASKLSDEEKEKLKPMIENIVPKESYTVQLEAMSSDANPFMITQPEFMRRMKEMQASGGGGGFMGMGGFPEMYNLVVNVNNKLISEILNTTNEDEQKKLVQQAFDLAKLSQGLLQGEELTNFIKRSYEIIA